MRLNESSLETKEPYHIPGYCGYCPQFKYKIKETFGKTTHDLLTSPDICRSTWPVLAPLEDVQTTDKESVRHKEALINSRGRQHGDQKYGTNMVPGYTGYIPKGQHFFGDRYAIFTGDAISHMEDDQQSYVDQQTRLRTLIKDQCMNGLSGNSQRKLPLTARSKKTKMYFPKGIQHSLSPYTYSNDDPRKYMLSGYTGFVPKSRETIGMGYPDITKKALCEFTSVAAESKACDKTPVVIRRPQKKLVDTKPIYIHDSGMVPHYTGHVPGEKFRFGRTFGFSTTNAVTNTKL